MTSTAKTSNTNDVFNRIKHDARLDTPCLVISAESVSRNIARMAEYCAQHRLNLRPHTKTHKSLKLAQLQIEQGATGLTVAKPGEAQVMANLGAEVLIAYPSVTAASLRAIASLSRVCPVLVAIDSIVAVDFLETALSKATSRVGVLVDIDVGLHRTGLQTIDQSLALAQQVSRNKNLELAGLFCYPGHIWDKPHEQADSLNRVAAMIDQHLTAWRKSGIEARTVSGGSTPTAYQSHLIPSVTEIRPGTYIFNDMNTAHGGFCELEDCAARFVVTVVSDAVPNQIVIDSGSKTLASDRCIPALETGHGYIVELPNAKITHLSEEHGQVDISKCDVRPKVGERLTIIPNHICPTVNLTDAAWWAAADDSIERLPIDTRGMVR
jgi:D-serine deaminase-like pyridoxal phosphate-dependent protein